MVIKAIGSAEGFLADVPQEYVFWCCDGQILKNLKQLRDAFSVMSEDTFAYHVNEAKNDFSNWVKDIIKDEVLASDMLKATSKTKSAKIVGERIAFLSGRSTPATTRKQLHHKSTRR